MSYDIHEHVHRFASWAASRAASTKGARFPVEEGQYILRQAGLLAILEQGIDGLPNPEQMDAMHRQWRSLIISLAAKRGHAWTHGIAAKLINVYLKAAYVGLATRIHPKVAALHPPLDRELLTGLVRANRGDAKRWRSWRDIGWSKFTSTQYELVISDVRAWVGIGQPLWKIESEWPGYQKNVRFQENQSSPES